MDAKGVLEYSAKHKAKILDLRFIDVPGIWQHVSYPIGELTEDSFHEGFGFDASSIRGWASIHESDMLLIPDPDTAFMDPFRTEPTLVMIGDATDPPSHKPYHRDPRHVAKRAEAYLASTGIADKAFFGAEAEFFIFDSVRFDQASQHGFYFIDSDEGKWNSGREGDGDDGPNLGYRTRYKEGYFPVPPSDHFQDLRTEMVLKMQAIGMDVECHHHEVATAGQAEIDLRFNTLLNSADNMMKYKYIIKNTAAKAGKTVTFMPKPIFADNGSGMHTHQSLWKRRQAPVCRRRLRGLVADGAVVCGRTAQACSRAFGDHRSGNELVQAPGAGLRSACEPGVLEAQPVGCGAHSGVFGKSESEAARVPSAGPVL